MSIAGPCELRTVGAMHTSGLDQDIAEDLSAGIEKRNEGLAEMGKAALSQIRRVAGQLAGDPHLVAFNGLGVGDRGRALLSVEVVDSRGETHLQTMDDHGDQWNTLMSVWDVVAGLLEIRFGTQHTFLVHLEDGMVLAGVDQMVLADPAAP